MEINRLRVAINNYAESLAIRRVPMIGLVRC